MITRLCWLGLVEEQDDCLRRSVKKVEQNRWYDEVALKCVCVWVCVFACGLLKQVQVHSLTFKTQMDGVQRKEKRFGSNESHGMTCVSVQAPRCHLEQV